GILVGGVTCCRSACLRLEMTTALVDQREISKELDHEDQSTDRESIGVSHRAVDVKYARSCPGAGRQAQHSIHHGRRYRHYAAEHLPSRADGWRDAKYRPHR